MPELHRLLRRQLKRHFGAQFCVPEAWQGVLGDISDEYQAFDTSRELLERSLVLSSQELHQANAEMRAVFRAIPDLLFRLDSQGVILDFKVGSSNDLLCPGESYLGKHFQKVPSKPLGRQFEESIRRVLATKTWVSLEYSMTLQNQECFYEARLVPLFDDQIVVMIRNTTERRRAETKLAATHLQLLETSRQAGMAEVATDVLHNVGNVLNSVNVSATLVADNTKKSKISCLGKVVTLLNEHAADLGEFMTTPKGRRLPGYLSQLAEQLVREQEFASRELELLCQNIDHIKDIVAMQQSYANISGITETVQLSDLVEDALRMNAGALARHDVKAVREYGDVPKVTVEKHKVLQILVNLIRNAKYACDDSGRKDKQLKIRLSKADNGARITVIDNGIGVPPENLTRIFNHGFTTRKGGHGFGLHSGALAARQLGGSLTVHSEGSGRGATFTLELPLQPPKGDL